MNASGGPGCGAGDPGAAPAAAARGDSDGSTLMLLLAPDPTAAREARAWVVRALVGWPDDSVDRARLLVSELVTNAVLHARTDITLRCALEDDKARFEIGDGHRVGPTPKHYLADSPTGRGMRLVALLAKEWGVERVPGGKSVWFTLSREMPPATPSIRSDPLGLADLELLAAALGEPTVPPDAVPERPVGGATGAPVMVHVRILGLPLAIYLEAEQHNDAVLRELDLIERSPRRGNQVPPRLLELAAELRAVFAAATTSSRAQVEEALRTRRERVDLDLEVPAAAVHVLTEMAQQLDEVDQFCLEGALLTLAASPRQRRFRHWYAGQVARQVAGEAPTPWPDGDD